MAGINLGPDHDLAVRLQTMEDNIRALSTRDVLQNASIGKNGLVVNGGGSITITGGGSLTVTGTGTLSVASGGLNSAGSITAATTMTAGTGMTATTGNIAASSGNVSASGTVTGGTGVTATTGDVIASAGNVSANLALSAGGNIFTPTGNIIATAGNVTAGGTVTGGTVNSSGTIASGGNITVGGSGNLTFNNGTVFSVYALNNAVSTGYFALYVNSDGRFGRTVSARRYKEDIANFSPSAQAVFALQLREYRLKTAVAELGADAPLEHGLIAEELIDCGLEWLVQFGPEGQPEAIAYEKIALALIPVIQDHEKRIAKLEG